jgi:hypothetical protein
MIKYLKKAFRSVINAEDWLDDIKKKEVIEKVRQAKNVTNDFSKIYFS